MDPMLYVGLVLSGVAFVLMVIWLVAKGRRGAWIWMPVSATTMVMVSVVLRSLVFGGKL